MPAGRPSDVPGRAAPIPGVEGVRAVAAVSVLVFHCWMYGADGLTEPTWGWSTGLCCPTCPLG